MSMVTVFWAAVAAAVFAVVYYLVQKIHESREKLTGEEAFTAWAGVAGLFAGGCGFTYLFCSRIDNPPQPPVPLAIWQEQEWVDEKGQVIVVWEYNDDLVVWKPKDAGPFSPQKSSPRTDFLPGMRFKRLVPAEKATAP